MHGDFCLTKQTARKRLMTQTSMRAIIPPLNPILISAENLVS